MIVLVIQYASHNIQLGRIDSNFADTGWREGGPAVFTPRRAVIEATGMDAWREEKNPRKSPIADAPLGI